MNTLKYLVIMYITLMCNIVYGQSSNTKIDGSEPFILKYELVEMGKYNDKSSKEFEMDARVLFTPSTSKDSGTLSIYVDGETEKITVNNIRGIIKDGKTYYMANEINNTKVVYVWSVDYFFYSNGNEMIQFTNKE